MFLDLAEYALAELLEANWETIRDEYLALPSQSFDPWVQRNMHGTGWSVFGLIAAGRFIPGGCQQCPQTSKILEQLEGITLAGFSRMEPGTHILPHSGWAVNEYRLHLGLVVPEGCRFRVGSETREWKEGKCLIFDDTVIHEAWNNSNQVRGNLMVDFLRPGKTEYSDKIPIDVMKYAQDLFGEDDTIDDGRK